MPLGMLPCGPRRMPRTSSAAPSRTWRRRASSPWSRSARSSCPWSTIWSAHWRSRRVIDGLELTLKSFVDALRKFHIEPVDPEGQPFDPQLHQAMSLVENAEVEPNTVIAVMQKGYTLNSRLVRPAMVMVSKAPTGE